MYKTILPKVQKLRSTTKKFGFATSHLSKVKKNL